MKWIKRLILMIAVLAALLAIVPLLVSLDDYRPQIERLVADKLKEPVQIKSLRLVGLPTPHVIVSGIVIGKSAELKVGQVSVTPELLSLPTSIKVIRSIDIEGLELTQAALQKIPVWSASDPKAAPAAFTVQLRSLRINDALLKMPKATFGPFDAHVAIAPGGAPERADITARDGRFKASIRPSGRNFDIEVNARDWRLPAGPPILFNELRVKGVATLNDVSLKEVQAKLYGGTVAGRSSISWQQGLQLRGEYAVNGVELRDLVPLFSKTRLSGRLTAKPVFSGKAAKPDQLMSVLQINTPFSISEGVLYGIDIQKAATSLITRDSSGETRFDTLSGHYARDRGTQRVTSLKVVSGSLAADGNVTVAPNDALSGRINAQVQAAGVTAVAVPLNISGTVASPMALPTKASMAGAAVGTAILGPLGTGIGAQVGGWADSLFGGDSKKDAKKK